MLLHDFLTNAAALLPKKCVLADNGRRTSYEQLQRMANSFALSLLHHGLKKGDRVGIYLENSLESVVSIFGTLIAGGVFVVINPQVKRKKLSYILDDCTIRFLVCQSKSVESLSEICNPDQCHLFVVGPQDSFHRSAAVGHKTITTISFRQASDPHNGATPPPPKTISIDLASLTYTSGSTGQPKGVMLTHLNMVTAADSITTYLENRSDDIILNYLPLSFDYGLYQVLMAIRFGGTVVLKKAFVYPYSAIETIVKEKITGLPLVPAMASLLLDLKNLRSYDLSSVRYITNTGQALAPSLSRGLRNAFPGASLYSMYGLTECKRVSYLPPEQIDIRPQSVGIAIPNTEVWLMDENGNRIDKPGITGELVIRGAHVMKGYWNKPQETQQVLKKGRYQDEKVLLSGDYFTMDSEGYLYFVARKDDIIKSGGERISPKEIEDVLYSLPGVSEAAVIGVPDKILGNSLRAFVVLGQGINRSAGEILQHCAKNLERSRVPGHIEIRTSLPKSQNGKISKRELYLETGKSED